ncbi:hypothetical protein PHLCEN_2v3420 [Hermanssonia centrifuga]|uniref:Uncharacterized protein n=1 Tax=Hermanssonia centrifuga TaxID=98765 RepID=A0A2R6QIU6_9APHY|nr:hypothetical protein PHLCEN_2v3420 [Hermanssonia centrifuga]
MAAMRPLDKKVKSEAKNTAARTGMQHKKCFDIVTDNGLETKAGNERKMKTPGGWGEKTSEELATWS